MVYVFGNCTCAVKWWFYVFYTMSRSVCGFILFIFCLGHKTYSMIKRRTSSGFTNFREGEGWGQKKLNTSRGFGGHLFHNYFLQCVWGGGMAPLPPPPPPPPRGLLR